MSNAKIRSKKKAPKVKSENSTSKDCKIPESSVFFNFQYITSDKNFNFEYLEKNGQIAKKAYKNILDSLYKLSMLSWQEIGKLSRKKGGFEMIEYSCMKQSITN